MRRLAPLLLLACLSSHAVDAHAKQPEVKLKDSDVFGKKGSLGKLKDSDVFGKGHKKPKKK